MALLFGNTVYAVTTVLAAFMAGLALGSEWLGRWSERRQDPIFFYALLEFGVAALGAVSLASLAGIRVLYAHASPAIEAFVSLRAVLRFVLAAIVLLPPTFLMGGTLPVLVRGLRSRALSLGTRVSRLYWLNTLGAAVGVIAAGFWLLAIFGGRITVLVAVGLNLMAGLIALRLRQEGINKAPEPAKVAADSTEEPPRKLLLAAFGIVGATALAYEIAWTRLLAIQLGSSTYAFTVMLATFLVGIALGSAAFDAWVRRKPAIDVKTFAATQTVTSAAALFFLIFFPHIPGVVVGVLRAGGNSFHGHLLAQCVAAALAMLPATIAFGFNFPLVTTLIAGPRPGGTGESAAVGRAYAANTIGAIAGAILAGFWLLPHAGAYHLIAIAAATNLALAFVLPLREKSGLFAIGVRLALVAGLAAVAASGAFYNRALATYDAALYYKVHSSGLTPVEMAEMNDVLFAAEGPNATVAVLRSEDYLALSIDGKVDASNVDVRTQLMLGHLVALLHSEPRSALVIGFGSGETLAALARYPEIERIDCVEIEPNVIRAAAYMEPLNQGVLQDPRVHIILDDGRNYLAGTRERYDVISSEPSNPWIAGIANLYTSEFYRDAAARLRPGGLFVQWVQAYSLAPGDLRMIIRTFSAQFRRVTLWRGGPRDYLLLGQTDTGQLSLERLRSVWTRLRLQADFRKLGLAQPEGLLAYHELDDSDLRRLSQTAPANTDDLTLLEFHAPRSLYEEDFADKNRAMIAGYRASTLPADFELPDRDAALVDSAETSLEIGDSDRADYFLKPLEQGSPSEEVLLLRGRIELDRRNFPQAQTAFEAASRLDPNSLDAEAELARATLAAGDAGHAEKLLGEVLTRDPKQLRAVEGMVELTTQRKEWNEAACWQEVRIGIDPALGCREYVRLGRDYLRAGAADAGEKWLRKALERDSYCHPAHRTLADLAIARKNWAEAKPQLEFLVRYAPDEDASVYSSLAGVDLALGNSSASQEALNKGLRIFPDDPNLHRLATAHRGRPESK